MIGMMWRFGRFPGLYFPRRSAGIGFRRRRGAASSGPPPMTATDKYFMSVGRAERLKAAKRGSWTGAYAKVALAAEKKERQRAARVLKSGARAAGVTGKATGNVIRSATAKMRAYKPLEGG